VTKLIKFGFGLSIIGIIFYFLSPSLLNDYAEMSRNAGLILFASGWAISLGSLVFSLGMATQKNRKRN